jgi:hypothetical protein
MSQNVTLPAIISAVQSRRAATAAPTKDEGRKMKAENSQQTMSRELQPKKVDRGPWTVDREPWTVLTTVNASRAPLQPKYRQVSAVYKRSNFAGKPPFLATFGDSRRSFRVAILAQHVVAATRDRI